MTVRPRTAALDYGRVVIGGVKHNRSTIGLYDIVDRRITGCTAGEWPLSSLTRDETEARP